MKPETYFKKHGCVYGISYKYAFGEWTGYSVRFTEYDAALEWLHARSTISARGNCAPGRAPCVSESRPTCAGSWSMIISATPSPYWRWRDARTRQA